jgi:hypothetical protein
MLELFSMLYCILYQAFIKDSLEYCLKLVTLSLTTTIFLFVLVETIYYLCPKISDVNLSKFTCI